MWSDIWNVSYIELRILKSSKLWSSQLWTQFKQLCIEAWKCQVFNGVWSRDLTILVRHSHQLNYEATDVGSWSFVSSNEPVKNGCEVIIIWNVSYIELRILKSSKLWSSQLWTQFKQLCIEAWKSQDCNGVWTLDLAIPVRRSNQLSYEATDVGSWSFVSSNEPVKNGCEVIYEMFHILNCGFWNQVSYDHHNCEHNLSNCI